MDFFTILKKGSRYVLFGSLIMWLFVGVYVGYSYVIDSSDQKYIKGGTFVEAIFSPITYLPYVNTSLSQRFYQKFLFDSCVDVVNSGYNVMFKDKKCHVRSKDNKTFFVSLASTGEWSDGMPFTLSDVFFSYNELVKNNIRNISDFELYKKVLINTIDEDTIRVVFPTESIDNWIFFTNFILPRHRVINISLDEYKELFSFNPTTFGCVRLMPQTTDVNSLVFDMRNCNYTNLSYYQVKNFSSFDEFKLYNQNAEKNIIDIYQSDLPLSGYQKISSIMNSYLALFYNTKSVRLGNRIRSELSYLIDSTFYTGQYDLFLIKDRLLFDALPQGNIDTLKNLLERSRTTTKAQQSNIPTPEDISLLNMKSLPDDIKIVGRNNSEAYYADYIETTKNLKITTQFEFDKMTISYNDGAEYTPTVFDKQKKLTFYNISPKLNNIKPGINKYVIRGYRGKTAYRLLTLTVYYFDQKDFNRIQETPKDSSIIVAPEDRIKIIYYQDIQSQFIVNKLQDIFVNNGLISFFEFEGYDNVDEFDGKIISNSYDIVIRSIDLGIRKDFSSLFASDQPLTNPSLYKNLNLSALILQHLVSQDPVRGSVKIEIDKIYQKDIPFLLLGKKYTSYYVKKQFLSLFPQRSYDLAMRDYILANYLGIRSFEFNAEKVFNSSNFISFIDKHISSGSMNVFQ